MKLTSGTGGGVANAASTNATYIAGTHVDDAVRWGSTGPLVLGHLNPLDPRSRAEDITPDGAVVVGDSGVTNGEAFRWTAGGGMLGMGRPVGAFRSYARAVSHDGNVIAGGGQFSGGSEIGFRWTAATGLTPIPDLPGGRDYSIPTAISADGNVIVGISSSTAAAEEAGFFEAYRWTASAGTQPLGDLPGGDTTAGPPTSPRMATPSSDTASSTAAAAPASPRSSGIGARHARTADRAGNRVWHEPRRVDT